MLLFALLAVADAAGAAGKPDVTGVGETSLGTRSSGYDCGDLPCLPGLDELARGFDIVYGNAKSFTLQPIFNFVSPGAQGKGYRTYTNPFNRSLQYAVPPSVHVVDSESSSTNFNSHAFKKTSDVAAFFSASVGAQATVKGFSLGQMTKLAASFLDDSQAYGAFAYTENTVAIFDASMDKQVNGNVPFSAGFTQALQALTNVNDTDAYTSFIAHFGTHYIGAATYGGKGVMTSAVNRKYSSVNVAGDIADQSGLEYKYLQAGGGYDANASYASADFTEGSHFSSSFIGGDAAKMNGMGQPLENYDEWKDTIAAAPAQVHIKVYPITELLVGGTSTPAVKAAMENAIAEYVGDNADECASAHSELSSTTQQLALANKKLKCINDILTSAPGSNCCRTIEDSTDRFVASMKCKCGAPIDLSSWGLGKETCEVQMDRLWCKNKASGNELPPNTAFLSDLHACMSQTAEEVDDKARPTDAAAAAMAAKDAELEFLRAQLAALQHAGR